MDEKTARITNRRALHDYFITHKIECGMVLVGSEVKSLRTGTPNCSNPSPGSKTAC